MSCEKNSVRDFYNGYVEQEWSRIDGMPEFLLTCRMIERYAKPGDTVLDIGGGPGRYSLHLAKFGCKVTLLELSEGNTKFAAAKSEELSLPIHIITGDALKADELVEGQFDHVLLMGPMYHLLDEAERKQAMEAAMKVLKPGGLIYVAFISMFANMIYVMRDEPEAILSEFTFAIDYWEKLVTKKSYAGEAFTKAYFIEPGEILPFMGQFPLENLHLFGQEGVTPPCRGNILSEPKEVVNAWMDFCEKTWEREELLSWSEHLMYVGRSIVSPDPVIRDEINYYNSLPVKFDGFMDIPPLSDGEVFLVPKGKHPGNIARRRVPWYDFAICKGHEKVGDINLRIGYMDSLYYGGHIGYGIDEAHRGNGYAVKACRLLEPVIRFHGMKKILITTDVNNQASKRVCEKLGLKLVREVPLPKWSDMYGNGRYYNNVYEWEIQF